MPSFLGSFLRPSGYLLLKVFYIAVEKEIRKYKGGEGGGGSMETGVIEQKDRWKGRPKEQIRGRGRGFLNFSLPWKLFEVF